MEFARRAGSQVVRKICVVVFALRRSVSFYRTSNWNSGYRLYAANEKIGICLTGAKRNRVPRGEAVERSETDEEWRNRAIFHAVRKKVQFEKLYVLICLRPISENVAVPHPPLRGTFPPGEGI